ncbi:MAG: condensation domain-containing protein, partial [Acidobacteria bacterium]|nr:condensation domain-containing protein [Acidobacteriota bacterium]
LHHIVADGWSMGILTRELRALYEADTSGAEPSLPELPIRFADFCVWQREQAKSGAWDAHLEYWRDRLAGAPADLMLATDRPRPEGFAYRGAHLPITISRSATDAVRALARDAGVTLYTVLLASFEVLLHRAAKQDDFTLGTTFANRDRKELEELIGFFANTLPLRADLSGDPTFRALLRRVREAILGGVVHQELPFALVVKKLQPDRDLGLHPLYRVVFDLLTPDRNPAVYGYGLSSPVQETVRIGDLSLVPVPLECGIARFDIAVFIWDMPDGLAGSFEFSTDLFDTGTIQVMIDAYAELLRTIVNEPDARLSALVEQLDRWESRWQADAEKSYRRSKGERLKGIKRRRS